MVVPFGCVYQIKQSAFVWRTAQRITDKKQSVHEASAIFVHFVVQGAKATSVYKSLLFYMVEKVVYFVQSIQVKSVDRSFYLVSVKGCRVGR